MTRFPQDIYNHLGILVNNKWNFSDRINSACRKGINTFYALSDIGSPYLYPLTIAHIYKTVVRPSMLYGCELWNNLSAKDTQRLHVFQHSGPMFAKAFLVCTSSVLKLTKESSSSWDDFVF